MIELILVGIGTGNPDHLTRQAVAALNAADLILIPEKGAGKEDLADLRRSICASVVTNPTVRTAGFALPVRDAAIADYTTRVARWHDAIAGVWSATIAAHLPAGGKVALLVWGDPGLYDSTLRIAARLQPPPRVTAIPGITAVQALTAAHGIALNEIGAPFTVTTGRRLRDEGFPPGVATCVVMLDGECSFQTLGEPGLRIWWGAYLGMAEELLLSGALPEVTDSILSLRATARARHGWIMDIYLLRRAQP
jgi:precorrin-6A synthase